MLSTQQEQKRERQAGIGILLRSFGDPLLEGQDNPAPVCPPESTSAVLGSGNGLV